MYSIRRFRFALAGLAAALAFIALAGGPQFKTVKTVTDLDKALAGTAKVGRPTMVDFTADWCAPCKKMEKTVFPDPAVQAALKGYEFLQVDVTENNENDQALLKRFNSAGPPVIAFFDARGKELKKCQVNGFQKADKFSAHIQSCANQS